MSSTSTNFQAIPKLPRERLSAKRQMHVMMQILLDHEIAKHGEQNIGVVFLPGQIDEAKDSFQPRPIEEAMRVDDVSSDNRISQMNQVMVTTGTDDQSSNLDGIVWHYYFTIWKKEDSAWTHAVTMKAAALAAAMRDKKKKAKLTELLAQEDPTYTDRLNMVRLEAPPPGKPGKSHGGNTVGAGPIGRTTAGAPPMGASKKPDISRTPGYRSVLDDESTESACDDAEGR